MPYCGGLAQLGEHNVRNVGVGGSNPLPSTKMAAFEPPTGGFEGCAPHSWGAYEGAGLSVRAGEASADPAREGGSIPCPPPPNMTPSSALKSMGLR